MVITNIETQKHNKDKVNIFIDGEYSFSLLTKECGDNYLYVGKELSEFEIHKLKNNNQKELAVNEIVNILSYGMKTEYELRKKLEEKGFDEEAITYAISKGIQHNYIDDEKYANCYIKERAIPNKWGSNKVFYLLQQKGIDKCIIQNAIDNLMSEDVLNTIN
jgi:regulatory protein